VNTPFLAADGVLLATQATLVALPRAGLPAPLARLYGRAWALLPPLSIAVVVAAVAAEPAVADGLTWFAFLAIPPGAALALGWAMHGGRPLLAWLALPLFVAAWWATGTLVGDACAVALTALSCVTLGRLLAGVVPAVWLKAGIVAMAVVDAILVFGNELQAPNAVLNAAVPAPGLPQLQYLNLHYATMGYGDVFVAGVLGGVLAVEGRRQAPVALLVFVLAVAWDLLFFVFDTLPATVPVAVALLIVEAAPRIVRRRRETQPASPVRPRGGQGART
jgi:hypothetical protein